jgi:hypothetical protein
MHRESVLMHCSTTSSIFLFMRTDMLCSIENIVEQVSSYDTANTFFFCLISFKSIRPMENTSLIKAINFVKTLFVE